MVINCYNPFKLSFFLGGPGPAMAMLLVVQLKMRLVSEEMTLQMARKQAQQVAVALEVLQVVSTS